MSTSEEERAKQQQEQQRRRRQLIERLNQKEELLGRERSTRRAQMTEEELEDEIERERNDWRNQFGRPGGA